jgi:hypothetical protein
VNRTMRVATSFITKNQRDDSFGFEARAEGGEPPVLATLDDPMEEAEELAKACWG